MTKKQILTLLLVLFVLSLIAAAMGALRRAEDSSIDDENLACNGDGFVCPDGSMVGRVPPSCEFSPCPGVVPNPGGLPGQSVGILEGTVTLSPTCPIERMPPDPQCAPRPYVTDVHAVRLSNGEIVASTKTTSEGVFVLDLPAGTYSIRAEDSGMFPRCGEATVTISSGERKRVDISCDTGIR